LAKYYYLRQQQKGFNSSMFSSWLKYDQTKYENVKVSHLKGMDVSLRTVIFLQVQEFS